MSGRHRGGRRRPEVGSDLGAGLIEDALAGHAPDALREDIELYRDAVEWLLGEAALARTSLWRFFEFVMRAEHRRDSGDAGGSSGASTAASGARLRCAPHQRLVFEFIEDHPLCVVRMPPDTGKTYCMATAGMYYLGHDVTERGAFISATQAQAMKPLGMMSDYIEHSPALPLVFPELRPRVRRKDPWTMAEITVDRPAGIRDPSMVATGLDGAIDGSRLGFAFVDDILNRQNVATVQQRDVTHTWFDTSILTRLDRRIGRCVVTNTAWHRDDLTHRLQDAGWPTLSIDLEGGILIHNADDWDTALIRPAYRREGLYHRLVDNDPDEEEKVPLWPERITPDDIVKLQQKHLPHVYRQVYMQDTRDDKTARCQLAWVEQCKVRGLTLQAGDDGGYLVICTGVDLGVGRKAGRNSPTVFFTIGLTSDLKRRVLDVQAGHWNVDQISSRFVDVHKRFKSIFRVEDNAAQKYMLDIARGLRLSILVRPHRTGENKYDPSYGVESVFNELRNGYWEIPADGQGRVPKQVQPWVNECLYYDPDAHTGDHLMASWFAREEARELGALKRQNAGHRGRGGRASLNHMSR